MDRGPIPGFVSALPAKSRIAVHPSPFPAYRRELRCCATAPVVRPDDAATSESPKTAAQSLSVESISAAARLPDPVMGIADVMSVLPHRFPFLLVDKVIEYEAGKRVIAVKNVTVNEPFFPGHFPDRPIMPGVLQIEALAQAGGLLLKDAIADGTEEKKDFFFGGVDNVRWRKPVLPGDTLVMEVVLKSYKARFGIAKLEGKACVDGKVACEAELTLVIDVQGKASKANSS